MRIEPGDAGYEALLAKHLAGEVSILFRGGVWRGMNDGKGKIFFIMVQPHTLSDCYGQLSIEQEGRSITK